MSPEDCIFVVYEGSNDRLACTNRTPSRKNFREAVLQQDGSCVVTNRHAEVCDAAHLISRSKGDEVMFMIILCDPRCVWTKSLVWLFLVSIPAFLSADSIPNEQDINGKVPFNGSHVQSESSLDPRGRFAKALENTHSDVNQRGSSGTLDLAAVPVLRVRRQKYIRR